MARKGQFIIWSLLSQFEKWVSMCVYSKVNGGYWREWFPQIRVRSRNNRGLQDMHCFVLPQTLKIKTFYPVFLWSKWAWERKKRKETAASRTNCSQFWSAARQNFLLCGSEFWVLSGFSFTTLCTKKENKPVDTIFTFIPKNPFTWIIAQ